MSGTDRIGVVSPHLDDAALSCGQLLGAHHGAEVVTVFSDGPRHVAPLGWWDKESSLFRDGDDVTAARREEDLRGLALVGAHPHHLGFWESTYRAGPGRSRSPLKRLRAPAYRYEGPDGDELVEAVAGAIADVVGKLGVRTWYVPLGLVHDDHRIAAKACLRVMKHVESVEWVVYEELPYAMEQPDDVAASLERLEEAGTKPEPFAPALDADLARKQSVIASHRSQLRPLGDRIAVAVRGPERYHALYAGKGAAT